MTYKLPLFWLYYPDCREILARYQAFNTGNDTSPISWEDHLEMHRFSSYITKTSNIYDRRLQDYLIGVDMLLASDKIEMKFSTLSRIFGHTKIDFDNFNGFSLASGKKYI